MTKNIVDGHYAIDFDPLLELRYIYPNREHAKQRDGWDQRESLMNWTDWQGSTPPKKGETSTQYNLFENVTLPKYIDKSDPLTYSSGSWKKEADQYYTDLRAAAGHIPLSDGSGQYILYFFFSDFAITEFEYEFAKKSPSTLNPEAIALQDALNMFYADIKDPNAAGIILDLRNNNGGDVSDIGYIAGRFINESFIVDYTKFKSGDGRLDYTPWVPERIIAAPEQYRMHDIGVKPIVLLVNRFSASCAETFTMAIKYLPNGYVIGENTAGMTSSPQDDKNRNGGSFKSGPFYSYVNTASTLTKAWDGKIYEDIGVPPDAIIAGDLDDLFASPAGVRDNRLEQAIQKIDPKRITFPIN
jgi:hypothetical protein